jgi:hypothetical protein
MNLLEAHGLIGHLLRNRFDFEDEGFLAENLIGKNLDVLDERDIEAAMEELLDLELGEMWTWAGVKIEDCSRVSSDDGSTRVSNFLGSAMLAESRSTYSFDVKLFAESISQKLENLD